jgi:NAD(P)H-hydrate epimerase
MMEDPQPRVLAVPTVSSVQMREVDRIMEEDLGISLLQMMENAGRHLARVAVERFLDGDPRGRVIAVLAGKGGNGGGALVAGRRLATWGGQVVVALSGEAESLTRVPRMQLDIVRRMGIPVLEVTEWEGELSWPKERPEADLVVDGIFGYSLSGAPRGPGADLIRWANDQASPTLSLDLPSGLHPDTGVPEIPTIRAAATLTLALPKSGLMTDAARGWVGELYLGDIGVPPEAFRTLGIEADGVFSGGDLRSLSAGESI